MTISSVRLNGAELAGVTLDGSKLIDIDFTGIGLAILEAKSMRGAQINGTKGLTRRAQTRLHNLGAIVVERDDYGPPNTAPGDDASAPAPTPPATQQQQQD